VSGFVLIHRTMIGNPQFRGKDDEYAAVWLVVNAAWKDTEIRLNREKVELKKGQCAFATSFLAEAWEVSKATAFRTLKHLEKEGFLKLEPKRGYTTITICNYKEYQTPTKKGETPNETETETPGETMVKRERNAGETNKNKDNKLNEVNEGGRAPPPITYEPIPEFLRRDKPAVTPDQMRNDIIRRCQGLKYRPREAVPGIIDALLAEGVDATELGRLAADLSMLPGRWEDFLEQAQALRRQAGVEVTGKQTINDVFDEMRHEAEQRERAG